MICYGLSFPVYGALHTLELSTAKRYGREYDEAIKATATIAAIEALPEDLRESAWQVEAWCSWRSRLTYNEWCCQMLEEYDLPEDIFLPSSWPRTEIQKLRETSTRS